MPCGSRREEMICERQLGIWKSGLLVSVMCPPWGPALRIYSALSGYWGGPCSFRTYSNKFNNLVQALLNFAILPIIYVRFHSYHTYDITLSFIEMLSVVFCSVCEPLAISWSVWAGWKARKKIKKIKWWSNRMNLILAGSNDEFLSFDGPEAYRFSHNWALHHWNVVG